MKTFEDLAPKDYHKWGMVRVIICEWVSVVSSISIFSDIFCHPPTQAIITDHSEAVAAFNTYQTLKGSIHATVSLTMLSVAADHCMYVFKRNWCPRQVKLIVEKDTLLLTHQMMHNVLFLIRKIYYTLTVADGSIQTPPGYKVTNEY